MAILYGYLFPLIFLVAFWAIYRNDPVPLALHLGQFLTVTILGSACFGLPTTIVAERERGVWRRYRLAPQPGWVFLASVLLARAVLLVTAALLQLALGFAFGMPLPAHPVALALAFVVASLAFLALGLVIAMLVDNVPAVQALGQCIFLPMLMIGGVAVQPGKPAGVGAARCAVLSRPLCGGGAAICGHRPDWSRRRFDLAMLLLIAAAGAIAAAGHVPLGQGVSPQQGLGGAWRSRRGWWWAASPKWRGRVRRSGRRIRANVAPRENLAPLRAENRSVLARRDRGRFRRGRL